MEEQVPLSILSARHKFFGTQPYRQPPHLFTLNYGRFINSLEEFPEESFIGLFGQWENNEEIKNCSLVEMIGYDDGASHLFLLKRTGVSTLVKVPKKASTDSIDKLSISFICTDNEPYFSLLKETVEHYKNIGFPFDINVVFYTNKEAPDWSGVTFFKQPLDSFNMASARNLSLKHASSEHVFMLDVDVRLSRDNILSILNKFQTIPNDGVFNLKNDPTIGNGLYFGKKEILMKNGYNEEFKLYWFEDTEYLMNFSRIGIVPIVVFEDFQRIDHTRVQTTAKFGRIGRINLEAHQFNFNLFSNILDKGYR